MVNTREGGQHKCSTKLPAVSEVVPKLISVLHSLSRKRRRATVNPSKQHSERTSPMNGFDTLPLRLQESMDCWCAVQQGKNIRTGAAARMVCCEAPQPKLGTLHPFSRRMSCSESRSANCSGRGHDVAPS